jgi:hypothetical protein
VTIYNNIYSGVKHRKHGRSLIGNVYLNAGVMVPLATRAVITCSKGVYMWSGRRVHHMGGSSVGSRSEREFVLFHTSIHNERVSKCG